MLTRFEKLKKMADALVQKENGSGKKIHSAKAAEGKQSKKTAGNSKLTNLSPRSDIADDTFPKASCSKTSNTSSSKPTDSVGVAPKEPSMGQLMGILVSIQKEQASQKASMSNLQGKVNEMFESYDDYDDYDDNNNVNEGEVGDENLENEDNSEPPSKRQKVDNVNVEKPSNSNTSIFKNAAQNFRLKEKVDSEVNSDLADMVNSLFREGISDEKYSDLMKNTLRPENCTSLTRTKVNQLIWTWLSPQTKFLDVVLQQHQFTVIKAAMNLVKLLDKLDHLKSSGYVPDSTIEFLESCIDLGLGSLALLAQ